MRAFFRDPLIGFAFAGGLIFVLYSLMSGPDKDVILVTPKTVALLEDNFFLTQGRQATSEDQTELIQRYVDEEILLRAAYEQGVDQQDGRVRQRLLSRMYYLLTEEPHEPSARDLEQLFASNPARYKKPAMVDLDLIQAAPGHLTMKDREALSQGSRSAGELGQLKSVHSLSQTEVEASYGSEIAQTLFKAPVGSWHGPVRIQGEEALIRLAGRQPEAVFADALLQQYLREDWLAMRRKTLFRESVERLRQRYRIEIELPGGEMQVAGQ